MNAVWAAFDYRDDLKSLILGAGVSPTIYNDQPDTAKVKIARRVLDELQQLGPAGSIIQRKIAVELCAMRRPGNGVANVKVGQEALDELRRGRGRRHRRHRTSGDQRTQSKDRSTATADR